MKTVFHLSDRDKWNNAINGINNLIKELIPPYWVTLVINSDAVLGLNDEAILAEIAELHKKDITIEVCQNSLNGNGVDGTQLPSIIKIVDAGVVSIVRHQESGFSYIKV